MASLLHSLQQDFKDTHHFLVIRSRKFNKKNFELLSPQVMRWADDLWVFRLDKCVTYWRHQAEKSHLPPFSLIEKILKENGHKGFTACVARHPWQGLLFVTALQRQKNILFDFDSPFAKNFVRDIQWDQWESLFPQLLRHFTTLKKNTSGFSTQLRQLQKFYERMNLNGPFQLQQASSSSIGKRFGALLAKVWDWTHNGEAHQDLRDFPWIPYKPYSPATTQRTLEYPMNCWETLEPLLREDFKKLRESDYFLPHYQVAQFDWKLTLYNLEELNIPISFRTPYDFAGDNGDFVPALKQAYYGFYNLLLDMQKRDHHLDLPENIPVISWKLTLSERLNLPPRTLSFFKNLKQIKKDQIRELENLLPIPLESYQLTKSFEPFGNYRNYQEKEGPLLTQDWLRCARRRPFFLHTAPCKKEKIQNPKFLERLCQNWWEQKSTNSFACDAYLTEREGKEYWVLRYPDGVIWEYGRFD